MSNLYTTLSEQLTYLEETKKQMQAVLTEKGQVVDDSIPFRSYIDNISNLGSAQLYNNLDEMNASTTAVDGSIGIVYDLSNTNFQGIFYYNKNKYEPAKTQLAAKDSDVMGVPYFGANGVSEGTFNKTKYFTDTNIADLTTYEKSFDDFYDTLDTTNISNWHSFYARTKIKHQKPRYINIQNAINTMWAFENANNIFEFPCSNTWDLSKVSDLSGMFKSCNNLRNIDTTAWRLTNANRAVHMFAYCTNININAYSMNQWDCCNLTDAREMFFRSNVVGASLCNWVKLNNTMDMFAYCPALNYVYMPDDYPISNASNMFYNCINLGNRTTVVFNNLCFSNVRSTSNMFYNCVHLNCDFVNWNFNKIHTSTMMFYKCTNLGGTKAMLNIENGMANLKTAAYMFGYCSNLKDLTYTNYNYVMPNVTNATHMFVNCENLNTFKYSSYNVQFVMPNLIYGSNMFYNCYNFSPNIYWNMPNLVSPEIIQGSGITNITMNNTCNLSNLAAFLSITNCHKLTNININGAQFDKLSSIHLRNASLLNNVTIRNISSTNGIGALSFTNLASLNTIIMNNIPYNPNGVSLTGFMTSCPNMIEINLANLGINKVNAMTNMVVGCSNIQTIDLSNTDLSKVTSIENAFRSLSNVTTINLSNTNMNNVTSGVNAFSYLPKITELDLSGLNGETFRSATYMFAECHNLQNINLPYLNTLTSGYNMFSNCYSLDINSIYGKLNLNGSYNVQDMFYRNFNIYNLDMKQLMGETCTRTDTSFMFRTCTNLRNISFANMNLPNLSSLHYTFYWAGPLELVDFTNCDLPKLASMSYTFGFSNMQNVVIRNLNAPNLTSMSQTFFNCHSLENIVFENFNAPNLTGVTNCFANVLSKLSNISFVNANLCSLPTPGLMFANCQQIKCLNYSGANLYNAKTLLPDSGWYVSRRLQSLDYSNADTSSITTLGICYTTSSGGRSLEYLHTYNIANINTTKITSLVNTFAYASKLVNVDFTNCNFCNVTNCYGMFLQCNNLSNYSIDTIISSILTMVSMPVKNLNVSNTSSPFYRTNITSSKYSNRLAELDEAGWTY